MGHMVSAATETIIEHFFVNLLMCLAQWVDFPALSHPRIPGNKGVPLWAAGCCSFRTSQSSCHYHGLFLLNKTELIYLLDRQGDTDRQIGREVLPGGSSATACNC